MSILKMKDLNLFNKRVFIRLDLNVPIQDNVITSCNRITACLPTIEYALKAGAKVILASHLGRPKEGCYDAKLSLLPVFNYLKKYFSPSYFVFLSDYSKIATVLSDTSIKMVLLENVRFNKGETNNSVKLSKTYASMCDIFVMDAFATAHRAHASTYGIANYVTSCIGPLLYSEIKSLYTVMKKPLKPMVVVIGGAKISTKFNILKFFAKKADNVIVGGGISNTFIAINNNIGKSLYEPNFIEQAKYLSNKYKNILIPVDCKVGLSFCKNALSYNKDINNIAYNEEIMDFGERTIELARNILLKAKTILWNGPVGVFEFPNFRRGTECIAKAIIKSGAFSLAGGGDTVAAIDLFDIADKISYISTGGGAFMEFIEGKIFPILSLLENR